MFEDINLGGRMKCFSLPPEEEIRGGEEESNLKTAFGTNLWA